MHRVLTITALLILTAAVGLVIWVATPQRAAESQIRAAVGPEVTAPDLPTVTPRRAPEPVRAIYLTSWSAATPQRVREALDLIETTELNGIVIDVKDYTGTVVFHTGSPLVERMGSEERRIDLAPLVQRLHERGIYVIVRIAAFQDHHLARTRPDLAVRDPRGRVWRDKQGLGWVDPASQEVWDYLVAIGRAAADAGVDELNFDYVRFPSDGRLDGLQYPVFDPARARRREVIRRFFAYLTTALRPTGAVLSADLFGLTTVAQDDMGIGQVFEDALLYFDFVAPMVYPSHYSRGFRSFANPAAHPYPVVNYSLVTASARRFDFATQVGVFTRGAGAEGTDAGVPLARVRPWLQAFNLGAPYPPAAVRDEIAAVYDAGMSDGWLLWSASNRYDRDIFEREPQGVRSLLPR